MASNQVRLDQEVKNRRRGDRRSRGTENVRFEEKKRINQDWSYLQGEELPNNASTDQIFNASYQNQGLQPQNLNEPVTDPEIDRPASDTEGYHSRFSRINSDTPESPGRGWDRRRRPKTVKVSNLKEKSQTSAATTLAKRGLARGRVTAANGFIFAVGNFSFYFIQLPLAIICLVCFAAYAAILGGLGYVEGAVAWWFNIEDIVGPLFAITAVLLHLLGLATLGMIIFTYRAALLKPVSGSKQMLKVGAFFIAGLFYSLPLLNLFPWGLLVMGVVWLYPE